MVWKTVSMCSDVLFSKLECLIRSSEFMTLHNNYDTALTEDMLTLVGLATSNHLPLLGPCGMSGIYIAKIKYHLLQLHTMITLGETDHMTLHVILMSLHQENGCSFPDYLSNGSNHFVEVGWVWDYTVHCAIVISCCFLLPHTLCFFLFISTGNSWNMTESSEYNAFLHLHAIKWHCDALIVWLLLNIYCFLPYSTSGSES